jgi:hypothetical protein
LTAPPIKKRSKAQGLRLEASKIEVQKKGIKDEGERTKAEGKALRLAVFGRNKDRRLGNKAQGKSIKARS